MWGSGTESGDGGDEHAMLLLGPFHMNFCCCFRSSELRVVLRPNGWNEWVA